MDAPRRAGRGHGGARRIGRWLALALAALALPLALAGAGCEALVSGDVPAFSCAGLDAKLACGAGQVCYAGTCMGPAEACTLVTCPAGEQCDKATGACSGGSVVTPDASAPHDGSGDTSAPVPDASGDTNVSVPDSTPPPTDGPLGPCRGLGCACSGPAACDSGVCGDTLTLTNDVYKVTQSNVCTKPCCTSLDCDANTVCFGAGNGGNYCIKPSILGRETPVTRSPSGTACTVDSECASARCVTGMCQDTCCNASAAACGANGTACTLGKFPGKIAWDSHLTFACVPSKAIGQNGDSCSVSKDCKSGLCLAYGFGSARCRSACRNTAECGPGVSCVDFSLSQIMSSTDIGVFCYPTAGGTKPLGSACTADSQCVSNSCDLDLGACADVCFSDADCAGGPAGWRCRPTNFKSGGTGGSFSVLSCGP